MEGGLDRVVLVVDHHPARAHRRVGVAAVAQGRRHPALGGHHVGGAAGRASLQGQRLVDGGERGGVRRRPVPDDLARAQRGPRPRRHLHDGAGRVALADVGLDLVVVVALRAQYGDRRLAGLAGAAAGVDAALGVGLGDADGALDRAPQGLVEVTLDGRFRLSGQGGGGREQADRHRGKDRSLNSSHAPSFFPAPPRIPFSAHGSRCHRAWTLAQAAWRRRAGVPPCAPRAASPAGVS